MYIAAGRDVCIHTWDDKQGFFIEGQINPCGSVVVIRKYPHHRGISRGGFCN